MAKKQVKPTKKNATKTAKKSPVKSKKSSPKKSAPKKSDTPAKQKDPKKVLAGKIRAQNSIKDSSGKYVSKIFTNEVKKTILATKKIDVSKIHPDNSKKIDQLIKEAGINPEQIKKFYEKNQFIFENLKKQGKLKGTWRNSNQIEKAIRDYKGTIFINDGKKIKEVSKAEAIFQVMNFKQNLSSRMNVVDFTIRPELSLDGILTLKIPDSKKLLQAVKKKAGVKNLSELDELTGEELMKAVSEALTDFYGKEKDINIFIS